MGLFGISDETPAFVDLSGGLENGPLLLVVRGVDATPVGTPVA
jgi:hypothetical protein